MVNALAVVGAIALVAVVAGGIGMFVATRPGEVATPTPTPTQSAGDTPTPSAPATSPSDLQADDVWSPHLDLEAGQLVAQGVELRDVRAQGEGARTRDDGSMEFERLDVDAVVPFAVVEQQVGRGLRLSPASDGLVRATLPLSVFGRSFDVAADARVSPEGDRIAIEPVRVVDAGFLGDVLEQIPTIRQSIPNLPDGLKVTAIEVVEGGFRIDATGENVVVQR